MPPVLIFYKDVFLFLASIFPVALDMIKRWQAFHETQLTKETRKKLAADIKSAAKTVIKTKDTSGLEDLIKNLGKPQSQTASPKPQN